MADVAFSETVEQYRGPETRGLGIDITPDIRSCEEVLYNLEPESRVAVQLAPEQVDFEDRFSRPSGYIINVALENQKPHSHTIHYPFGLLLSNLAAQANGESHEVLFLEDETKRLRELTGFVRAQEIDDYFVRQSFENADRLPGLEDTFEQWDQTLIDQRTREWTAAYYAHEVELPDMVAQKILDEKPDLAFVDERVVKLLAADKDVPEADGFTRIIEIEGQPVRLVGLRGLDRTPPLARERKGWLPWNERVGQYMNKREHYARRKRAAETGRILSDGRPAFVGTFTPDAGKPSAEGLFEVYPDTSQYFFQGFVEDMVGTARFRGDINDYRISFRKEYIPEATLMGSDHDALWYHGKRTSMTEYSGDWVSEKNPKHRGEFTLHEARTDS